NNLNEKFFESEEYFQMAEKLRGSLMLMGPLLSRFQKAFIPSTGGDKIGKRPIDTHISSFLKIGVALRTDNRDYEYLFIEKDKMIKNQEVLLEEASVTGTANLIMASTIGSENITIFNVASETYISQLISLLNNSGMNIEGAGSNRIVLNGSILTSFEKEIEHTVLPDFVEVASFVALAIATKSSILIKNAGVKYLGQTLKMFDYLGCKYEIIGDDINVLKLDKYNIAPMMDGSIRYIYSSPWPMISPDILSVGIVASLQCEGSVLWHEKMYEARMFFVDKLIAMKANVVLCDPHRVVVIGNNWKSKLVSRKMSSPDIRAGIALLIATLGASGVSEIENIDQIDRGYERIEERLATLGAQIERLE
ncbi:MAG: UDP-N-acetylglucosamine 1-carboxyvinyltransferase, partial [Patescibacteria group bacterium]|nr:UDP-N-acetylglucosamine 1-carboxyvinyltransferase [Patescibacteria group bacterium]